MPTSATRSCYAGSVAERLDDPEWAGEHYQTLRAGLEEGGEEFTLKVVEKIDACRSQLIKEHDDIDLIDDFAINAAYPND